MDRPSALNARSSVPPRPSERTMIPAGTGGSVVLRAGSRAHVVNTIGRQVADTWAIALDDPSIHLSTSHTRLSIGRLSPRPGDVLVDNRRQPLVQIVADTSPGNHDMLIPACDVHRYRDLGFDGDHRNCVDNFKAVLAAYGIASVPTPEPVNLFMAVPVGTDGSLALAPSTAEAGSEVVLEALRDLILVVSACPQDLVPISGVGSAPRGVDLYSPPGGH